MLIELVQNNIQIGSHCSKMRVHIRILIIPYFISSLRDLYEFF